jgi:hypothetical protein
VRDDLGRKPVAFIADVLILHHYHLR